MRIHVSQTWRPPLLWFHSSSLQTCCHVSWFSDSTDCTACRCFVYVLDFGHVRAVVVVVCKKGAPFIMVRWLSVISDIRSLYSMCRADQRCVCVYLWTRYLSEFFDTHCNNWRGHPSKIHSGTIDLSYLNLWEPVMEYSISSGWKLIGIACLIMPHNHWLSH